LLGQKKQARQVKKCNFATSPYEKEEKGFGTEEKNNMHQKNTVPRTLSYKFDTTASQHLHLQYGGGEGVR
jgi:hypothetical protein